MVTGYWLKTNLVNRRRAAGVLRKKAGFIGFYPGSFEEDHWLVAFFAKPSQAGAAAFDVETQIPVGGADFASKVETYK